MGESSLLWLRVAAGLYSLGLLDAIITTLRRRESMFQVALAAFRIGAIFHFVSIAEQGLAQNHFPANDIFENLSLTAWVITAAFLGFHWRYRTVSLGVFVFPLVFVMTLVAALRSPVASWQSEAVRNTWLTIHIVLAVLAYAALLFTAVAAVAYLIQERQLKQKALAVYRLLPPLGTLDEMISRSLAFGFAFITVAIVIGSVWSYISYGTSWIDNGLNTTAFITWGIYLALVFFRVSAGWRGRKAAVLAIVALCCSAVTWIAHAQLEHRLTK